MRGRGGFIGFNRAATTTAASGVWTVREAESLRRAGEWPRGSAAPTSLAAAAGDAQLALSWTAPTTTHGTITNYLVEYTASGGSAQYVLTNSTSTSYTLTGLTNGTSYTVRVAAVNFTAGDWSGTATGTARAVNLTVSPASGTSDGGTAYSWSGSGTAASPLETSDAAAPNGIDWGSGYGANTYRLWTFTCGVSGTLTVEFGGRENEGAEIPNFVRYVRNGTLSTTFAASQTFFGTHGARRTLTVTAGDVIKLSSTTGNSYQYGRDWTDDDIRIKGKFRLWIS